MSEVGHKTRYTPGSAQTSQNSYTALGTSPDHRILGTELDGSSEYILIARAIHGGSNVSGNDHYMAMTEAGVGELAESESRIEPRSAATWSGHIYGFLDKVTTAATPNNYEIRGRSPTNQMRCNGSYLTMIKLDDLTTDDWKYAAIDTDDTGLSSTLEDGASISLPAGDWLICGFGRFLMNGIETFSLEIDVGGTAHGKCHEEGEDSVENRAILTSTAVTLASTTTVKIRYGQVSGTGIDLLSSRIFAIKLDAFEDHALIQDTDVTDIAADATVYTVQTLTHTSDTAATRDWAVFGQALWDIGSRQCQSLIGVDRAGTEFLGDTVTNSIRWQGTPDIGAISIFGEYTSHPDATNLDFDLNVLDDDPPGNGDVIESFIAAFTWELAATAATASGTPSLTALTASGAATVRKPASGTATLAAATASGAATVRRPASGAATIPAAIASGVATVRKQASGAATIAAIVAAGAATVVSASITASGTPSIPSATASGAATVHRAASGTPSIAALIASGAATVPVPSITASGSPSITSLSASGVAEVIRVASGTPVIPSMVALGAAFVHRSASGAASIPAVVAAGTVAVAGLRTASGSPSIPATVAAGVAVAMKKASGAADIPALLGAGTAKVVKVASETFPRITTPSIVASGAASLRQTASGTPSIPNPVGAGTTKITKHAHTSLQIISDDFERAGPALGANWRDIALTGYNFLTIKNSSVAAMSQIVDNEAAFWDGEQLTSPDQIVEIELTSWNWGWYDANAWIWIRGNSALNLNSGFYAYLSGANAADVPPNGDFWLEIYRWDAPSTFVQLAFINILEEKTIADGDRLCLQMRGDVITAWLERGSGPEFVVEAIDTAYATQTGVGMSLEHFDINAGDIESFRAANLDGGPTAPSVQTAGNAVVGGIIIANIDNVTGYVIDSAVVGVVNTEDVTGYVLTVEIAGYVIEV